MSRFSSALVLLVLLHGYVGVRLIPDLPIGTAGALGAGLLLVVSCAAIPLSVMWRRAPASAWTDRATLLGLFMMGLFSSLFVFTLIRDLALFVALLLLRPESFAVAEGLSAIAALSAAVAATVIGFVNARRRARIVRVDVPIADLPDGLHGFAIAQISDIHVGPTIKRRYLEQIVDAVNGIGADVIAVTGDIVDGAVRELAPHVEPLSRLSAPHGAYLVTGNHEYYSGERAWTREFTRLGLTVLKNEHVLIRRGDAQLLLAGVTDFSAHHFDPAQRSDPFAAIAGAPVDVSARVLLAHQPRSAFAAHDAGFDLQISGHTHGGQFWPWNHFVRFQQPFTSGLQRHGRLLVYTSRGTGYWGPPKRFGAPSEITVLRLVRAS